VNDKLHSWEKWPIGAVFVAQGLYAFVWYIGKNMPKELADLLPWLYVAGGIAAWLAIDGSMIATIAGMRAGRRSRWSVAAIVVTAAFGAGLALDLHGAVQGVASWLHAGFALTIVCYLLHLAAPLRKRVNLRARRRYWVRKLIRAVRNARAEARSFEGAAAQAQAEGAQLARTVAQLEQELAQTSMGGAQEVASIRAELQAARAHVAQLEREAAQAQVTPAQVEGLDLRTVAQWLAEAGVSGREVARRLQVSESTVRNWKQAPRSVGAAD
jgi:DNA-binding transcriptional regulator YiaG